MASDFHCTDDLDANLSIVEGNVAVLEVAYRTLTTPTRHLITDPTWGYDIAQHLHTPTRELVVQQRAEIALIEGDERIEDASTSLVFKKAGDPGVSEDEIGAFDLEVSVTTAEGPFEFTLDPSTGEVTSDLLGTVL